jgi:hypothetical protein
MVEAGESNGCGVLTARNLLILRSNRTSKIRQFSQLRYNFRYNPSAVPTYRNPEAK